MAAPPPLPPPLSAVGPKSYPTTPKLTLTLTNHHYQVQAMKKEGEPRLEASKTLSVSRRDVVWLTAVTFWSAEPKPVKARTVNRSEIKRKFMEKVKQLKEKAGFANPEEDTVDKNKTPQSSSEKDKESPNHLGRPIKTLVQSVFS